MQKLLWLVATVTAAGIDSARKMDPHCNKAPDVAVRAADNDRYGTIEQGTAKETLYMQPLYLDNLADALRAIQYEAT